MVKAPKKIHVDLLVKPTACHATFSILLQRQQKVHDDIICDETMGILEKVPYGEPTAWCHCMAITRKHDPLVAHTLVAIEQVLQALLVAMCFAKRNAYMCSHAKLYTVSL